MTSRRWLIKLMKQAAKRKNITFESIRQRGSHEIFQLDGLMIPIPGLRVKKCVRNRGFSRIDL